MKFEDLQEEIEDILYSVQNNLGNSHLFSTDLCTDIAKEIIGTLKRHLTNAMHSDGEGCNITFKKPPPMEYSVKPESWTRRR